MQKETIGNAILYLADSYEFLVEDAETSWPELGHIDAIVTDPPWGVKLGETGSTQEKSKKQRPYEDTPDTPEYIKVRIVPMIEMCIEKVDRLLITPGNKCNHMYPQPNDIGAWFNPNGNSYSAWGFHTTTLLYYYGKDPLRGKFNSPNGLNMNGFMGKHYRGPEKFGHPCPKPIEVEKWRVKKVSREGETILDPLGGSAAAIAAAVTTGRKGIYIDCCERYFQEACKRVENAQRQGRMIYE